MYKGLFGSIAVALKETYAHLMDGDAKGFIHETGMMLKLRHPHVISLFGLWKHPTTKRLFMVMEYCPAGTLYDAMHKATTTPSQRVVWGTQIAEAMQFLHSREPPVIHRDLKPHNVLLDDCQKIKLCDFGSSRAVNKATDDKGNITRGVGTFHYMAPECFESGPKSSLSKDQAGKKMDVYSYCMLLWELLTGKDIFGRLEIYEIEPAVVEKNERPALPDSLSTDIKTLMQQMWHRSPSKRPDFASIAKTLRSIQCFPAPTPPTSPRSPRPPDD